MTQKQRDLLEVLVTTNQAPTKRTSVVSRLLSWYHDERAYGYRVATVNFHLAACGFVTPEATNRYLHQATECAHKARTHWDQARKYEGGG